MLLRFWADLGAPVDRRTYVLHGLGLAAVKYAGDVALVWRAAGRLWTPTDYLQSVYSLVSMPIGEGPWWLLPALGLWTLPFVWLGVTLTFRRALDAGRSCWWAFMFFVPYANYALMAALAVVPGATAAPPDAPPRDGRLLVTAILSITAGASLGLLALAIMVVMFRAYTAALFFGAPFAMGAITSFLFNRQYDASIGQTASVTVLMFAVGAGLAFLLATEGVVCIVMALPLALVTGLFGALLGRAIALMGQRIQPAFSWYELDMAPEGYWQVLSDYLIQRIHLRVLDHIKHEVETSRSAGVDPVGPQRRF